MRKLISLASVCALATIVGIANADLIIDNQTIPGSDIGSITVGPISGDVFITTLTGYTVTRDSGDTLAITGFSASPATIVAGTNTTLSWSTQNAQSCEASGGFGAWSGTVAVNGSMNVTTATPDNYTFTLTCSDGSGGQVVDTTAVTVNPANAVTITSFSAAPSVITEGGSTTISWAAQNAQSCTASGGFGAWTGTVGTSGSMNVTTDTAANYTFALACSDGSGGQDTATTSVLVNPDVAGCDGSPLVGTTKTWLEFWGVQFPAPRYDNMDLTISQYGYVAIKFNTADIVKNGRFISIETTQTDGIRRGAISMCPGEFDEPASCTHSWGIGGNIGWSTDGTFGACELLPNTDYYFNITFVDLNKLADEGVLSSSCNRVPCRTTMQHISL